jgi:hypothetical protein
VPTRRLSTLFTGVIDHGQVVLAHAMFDRQRAQRAG